MAKKATAPRPGVGKRTAAAKQAQRVLRITIGDETRELAPEAVSIGILTQVKAATKMSFRQAASGDTFDAASLAVLWWVAGTTGGKLMPWHRAAAEFDELLADLTEDDIEVIEVTPDDEDGEDSDPES